MKRSQKGCLACEAKAEGATAWQIGYIAGSHSMSVTASADDPDDVEDDGLCALHKRLGREATVISFRIQARKGAALIAADQAASHRKGNDR